MRYNEGSHRSFSKIGHKIFLRFGSSTLLWSRPWRVRCEKAAETAPIISQTRRFQRRTARAVTLSMMATKLTEKVQNKIAIAISQDKHIVMFGIKRVRERDKSNFK